MNNVADLGIGARRWNQHPEIKAGVRRICAADFYRGVFCAFRELKPDLAEPSGELCENLGRILIQPEPQGDGAHACGGH